MELTEKSVVMYRPKNAYEPSMRLRTRAEKGGLLMLVILVVPYRQGLAGITFAALGRWIDRVALVQTCYERVRVINVDQCKVVFVVLQFLATG